MSSRNTLLFSLTTAACALLASNVALAGGNGPQVPAPGILGLVAIGVVVAIAVARSRK
jgi:hypothetical protein